MQEGRQHGIQQQIDLAYRNPEQRRHHQQHDAPHPLVTPLDSWPGQQPQLGDIRQLERQLGKPGDEHAPGQRHDRLIEIGGQEHRRHDHADVEQHRREAGHREIAVAVQHPRGEGRQRDQHQIGKGDAQQLAGQLHFRRIVMKARREDHHHIGREQHAQCSQPCQNEPEHASRTIHQLFDVRQRALGAVLRQHRHEGLGEGPLGEQPAEEVGDLERDEERIRRRTGAEVAGDHHIAYHAQHARQQGHDTDHGAGAQQSALADFFGHLSS